MVFLYLKKQHNLWITDLICFFSAGQLDWSQTTRKAARAALKPLRFHPNTAQWRIVSKIITAAIPSEIFMLKILNLALLLVFMFMVAVTSKRAPSLRCGALTWRGFIRWWRRTITRSTSSGSRSKLLAEDLAVFHIILHLLCLLKM